MIKQKVSDLVFFHSLMELTINSKYFNLHNDYRCIHILYNNDMGTLIMKFISDDELTKIQLVFYQVKIVNISITIDSFDGNYLVIDALYRGRAEHDGHLLELSDDDKGYMYLDFWEGPSFEFWSYEYSIEVEDSENPNELVK